MLDALAAWDTAGAPDEDAPLASDGLRIATERRDATSPPKLLLVNEDSAEPCVFGEVLTPRDLVVVNDAATLPASLSVESGGRALELRLVHAPSRTPDARARFDAVLFGEGDYRTPTERRPLPPRVRSGTTFTLYGHALRVVGVSDVSPRLLTFESLDPFTSFAVALYRHGAPVQYAYLKEPLHLWDTQTSFARSPLAVEAPSATYLLPKSLPCDIAFLTHAAGLSDTGDRTLNGLLPFPERYQVPERTVRAVAAAKARGGRIFAIGTSVTRALESAARASSKRRGTLVKAGSGLTRLHIGPKTRLLVVDGIVTGVHDAHTSHRELLSAFLPRTALERAYVRSSELDLATHEFGDGWLVLPRQSLAPPRRRYRNERNLST